MKVWRPNWWWHVCQSFNRQESCDHLKGGLRRVRSRHRDYNVSIHTFSTNETRIRCLNNCGWEVYNKPEFKFKWAHGMRMVINSTNTRTASEIALKTDYYSEDFMLRLEGTRKTEGFVGRK